MHDPETSRPPRLVGRRRACIELALAMATVGASAVLGKQAVADVPVAVASALRFGLAALVLVPLAIRAEGGSRRVARRDYGVMLIQAVAGVFGFALFWMHGLRLTGAAEAGIVASTTPAAVAVASWLLLGSRPGARQAAGIALAVGGVAVLTVAGSSTGATHGGSTLGTLLILGAVACEALFLVLGKAVGARVQPLVIAATVTVFGFVLFLPLAAGEVGGFDPAAVPGSAWGAILLYALGPTVVGYVLAYRALAVLPATTAGIFGALVPVVAVLLAALILGEGVGLPHLAGMALVLAALAFDVAPRLRLPKPDWMERRGPRRDQTALSSRARRGISSLLDSSTRERDPSTSSG